MTRIIGGMWGGRRIGVPPRGTRPTTDRVREAMFSTLTSLLLRDGTDWGASRVVDLFAGSGALGIEAASRGARDVVLVESARRAADVVRSNVAALSTRQVGEATMEVAAMEVATWAASWRGAPRTMIFADPPYAVDDAALRAVWALMAAHDLIAEDALIAVERPAGSVDPLGDQWEHIDQRRYGDTHVWYGRRSASSGVHPLPARDATTDQEVP